MSVTMSDNTNNPEQTKQNNTNNDDEWKGKYRQMVSKFVPYDPRFPNQNQTRNCQQNYIDYHRCLKKKDGDEDYCSWYKNAYMRLCPPEWHEKWDEQREAGTFPVRDIY